jgi:hypothetical protein
MIFGGKMLQTHMKIFCAIAAFLAAAFAIVQPASAQELRSSCPTDYRNQALIYDAQVPDPTVEGYIDPYPKKIKLSMNADGTKFLEDGVPSKTEYYGFDYINKRLIIDSEISSLFEKNLNNQQVEFNLKPHKSTKFHEVLDIFATAKKASFLRMWFMGNSSYYENDNLKKNYEIDMPCEPFEGTEPIRIYTIKEGETEKCVTFFFYESVNGREIREIASGRLAQDIYEIRERENIKIEDVDPEKIPLPLLMAPKDTPWRCIGHALINFQAVGYTRIGLMIEAPENAATITPFVDDRTKPR